MSDDSNSPSQPPELTGPNGGHRFTQQDRKQGGKKGFQARIDRHGNNASITRELYDKACEIYLRGDRTYSSVMRGINVAKATAKKLVDQGYPNRNWAALKDRALLWDRNKVEAEQKAHAQHTLALLDQQARARTERHAILRFAKAGLSTMIQTWQSECKLASSKPKSHPQADPNTLSMQALALTGERLMNAMARFRDMEEVDLELMASKPDETEGSNQVGLAGLPTAEELGMTPSDVEFIINTKGRIPDHLEGKLRRPVIQGK